jgi:hypothetical protein
VVYLRKLYSIPSNHRRIRALLERRRTSDPAPDLEPVSPSPSISVFTKPRMPGDAERTLADGAVDLLLDRLMDTHLLMDIVNEREEPAARLTADQYERICRQVPARSTSLRHA